MVKRAVADLEELQIRKFQIPPNQIEAPDQLSSETSKFNLELQPNAPLAIFWGLQINSEVATERPLSCPGKLSENQNGYQQYCMGGNVTIL